MFNVSSDDESFIIGVSKDRSIKVTTEVVKRILGIPVEDGNTYTMDKRKSIPEYNKLCDELVKHNKKVERVVSSTKGGIVREIVVKMIHVKDKIEYIKEVNDVKKEAYSFFCTLVGKLLMSTKSNYIIPNVEWLCSEFERMCRLNWCSMVCQYLKDGISAWQQAKNKVSKKSWVAHFCCW
jgi:hypothetical protein